MRSFSVVAAVLCLLSWGEAQTFRGARITTSAGPSGIRVGAIAVAAEQYGPLNYPFTPGTQSAASEVAAACPGNWAAATSISARSGTAKTAGTIGAPALYKVTANLGTTPDNTTAIVPNSYVCIDLQGYTVYGVVLVNAVNPKGFYLFNGELACDDPSSLACYRLSATAAADAPLGIFDVRIRNTGASESERRGISLTWMPSSYTGATPGVKIFRNDLYGQHCVGCTRQTSAFVQTLSNVGLEFKNNKIGMDAAANAFKGLTAYKFSNGLMHHNSCDLPAYTGSQDGTCLEPDDAETIQDGNWQVYANIFDVRNNRGFRPRNQRVVHHYSNTYLNLDHSTGTSPVGATLWGALAATPGSAPGWVLDMTGSVSENNTYACVHATCYIHKMWAGSGVRFINETVTSTSGGAGTRYYYVQSIATGLPTPVTATNANNTLCGINAPANTTINTDTGNTTTYGTFTNVPTLSGAGTNTLDNGCTH